MTNSITDAVDKMLGHYSSFTQVISDKKDSEVLDLAFQIAIAAVAKMNRQVVEEQFVPGHMVDADDWAEEIMDTAYNAYHKLRKTNWEK